MSVNLDEFFNLGVTEPINRLAYSQEDIDYKIKIIQKLQEMGITITMDKIGNICGKLEFGPNPSEKTYHFQIVFLNMVQKFRIKYLKFK